MPTENPSSNTEMVSVPFQREGRYIVIKLSDLAKVPPAVGKPFAEQLTAIQRRLPERECLVIESDWPEYGPAWASIEARVTGKPAQHQGEPVALPARKAITAHGLTALDSEAEGWNACLDEIAKLGPLYTRPVQGDPLGWVRPQGLEAFNDVGWVHVFAAKGGDDSAIAVYTHADPGEVERLREGMKYESERAALCLEELQECESQRDEFYAEITGLRAKLAERDALLRKCLMAVREQHCDDGEADFDLPAALMVEIDAALSASAEPSAPKCVPEKPSRCTSCDNCQGFNTGHDSTQQKPYSIRCDNCHKEARAADHTGLARAWNALNQGE